VHAQAAGVRRWSTLLTVVRVGLGLIFAMYGLLKVLGGQYNYGDWVIDKKTTDGTSLVWAFFGYSQFYGRLTGLFELIPAILLLIPRTATLGALALFAVSLNITAMDFAYHYPSVKYMALLYTSLLGLLLWADRHKLMLLLEDNERARAALATISASRERTRMNPRTRKVLLSAVAIVVVIAANVIAASLSRFPTAEAAQAVAATSQPNANIELLRTRAQGLFGVNWTSTLDFRVAEGATVDTVRVLARKVTGFLPWQVERVERGTRKQ
jgi:uncharacterized membrane protein YphA (DoxX/SURF4 family)